MIIQVINLPLRSSKIETLYTELQSVVNTVTERVWCSVCICGCGCNIIYIFLSKKLTKIKKMSKPFKGRDHAE